MNQGNSHRLQLVTSNGAIILQKIRLVYSSLLHVILIDDYEKDNSSCSDPHHQYRPGTD
jgi:hypothetical protein